MASDIDVFVDRVNHDIVSRRRLPEATYRLQFHSQFTFRDACRIIPYLFDLGVTHCYASPYLKARPGSTHGYDIIDHRVLNPEIGSDEDYAAFGESLKAHGLGQILDTVPNHMGVATNDNPWWNDVLENGPASRFANFFDIAWHSSRRPELEDRVLLPVLGDPYGQVLESGQIRLSFDGGSFAVNYYEHRFPVAPRSYELLLSHRLEELEKTLVPEDHALLEYKSILTALRHLPGLTETDPDKIAERQREKEVIKRRLATLVGDNATVREFIERNVELFNGKPDDSRSFDLLDQLLDQQAYRLSYWRVAADEINYRRFFDVNELAALSMEREEVFEATHELILRLLQERKLDGLRIDHPDGLYDPTQYLLRLQQHYVLACARALYDADPQYRDLAWDKVHERLLDQVGKPTERSPWAWPLYVVVEKILGANEPLRADWATYGTSGYDFVNVVNGLFVDAANAQAFTRLYRDWIQDDAKFAEIVYQKKFLILQVSLSSELHTLAYQLDRLAQKHRWSRDFTLTTLRHALREVIACFPVYRSYISDEGVHEADRQYVETAVRRAMFRNPALSRLLFRFVRDMLLQKYPESAGDEERAEQLRFAGKFQQVTSPVMAKGVEDTAFYVYNRLLALNEVGGDPVRFGVSAETLHNYSLDRRDKWPWALSPLSTHDTKRSEDVRARLNVLSELPQEWQECLGRWGRLNEPYRRQVDDVTAPDPDEEYLLYQTLLGAWPLAPMDAQHYAAFVKRVQDYMLKALHEAKVHSSWINPDTEYDAVVGEFVARILDEKASGEFLEDFRAFQRRVSHYGLFNSLAQTLLKISLPGVPDTYQGTEVWDFSLVDPDNRRPVDYDHRRRLLQDLQARVGAAAADRRSLARDVIDHMEDGRVKLYVTWQSLQCRRDRPGLFSSGEYLPTEADGSHPDHVFGFVRRSGEHAALVAVPRLLTRLVSVDEGAPLGARAWLDTRIVLPTIMAQRRFRNVFTEEVISFTEHQGRFAAPLADVFAHFPVALFVAV